MPPWCAGVPTAAARLVFLSLLFVLLIGMFSAWHGWHSDESHSYLRGGFFSQQRSSCGCCKFCKICIICFHWSVFQKWRGRVAFEGSLLLSFCATYYWNIFWLAGKYLRNFCSRRPLLLGRQLLFYGNYQFEAYSISPFFDMLCFSSVWIKHATTQSHQ